jgi:hypothetical protein
LAFLEEQKNEHHILTALNQLPKGLRDTYDAAVARIKNRPVANDVKVAIKTLKWLTFVKENIHATALQHAIAIRDDSTDIQEADLENIPAVLSLCLGLVVVDQESGNVRLVHETTQEHFRKYFGNDDGNSEIASDCLRYFSLPGFSDYFADKWMLDQHSRRYPLSGYAARYWADHIGEGLEDKFCSSIIATFAVQGKRNLIYQIGCQSRGEFMHLWLSGSTPMVQMLHLAALFNLPLLIRQLLPPQGKIEKLYIHNMSVKH